MLPRVKSIEEEYGPSTPRPAEVVSKPRGRAAGTPPPQSGSKLPHSKGGGLGRRGSIVRCGEPLWSAAACRRFRLRRACTRAVLRQPRQSVASVDSELRSAAQQRRPRPSSFALRLWRTGGGRGYVCVRNTLTEVGQRPAGRCCLHANRRRPAAAVVRRVRIAAVRQQRGVGYGRIGRAADAHGQRHVCRRRRR